VPNPGDAIVATLHGKHQRQPLGDLVSCFAKLQEAAGAGGALIGRALRDLSQGKAACRPPRR
jgi:hypothetical protein